MIRPPKAMFQDTITLKHLEVDKSNPENNPYGEPETVSKTEIKNVRFSLRTVYSGTNNDRQVVANATIVVMSEYSEPFYEFTEQNQGDKINFSGHDYTIKTINRDIEPFSNEVYQYRLWVI